MAPGISSANTWPWASGNIGSAVPWITNVGMVIDDSGLMWPVDMSHDVVVLQRRDVVDALHVPADQVTACGFVEWSVPASEKS